jgi:hypothetical protein
MCLIVGKYLGIAPSSIEALLEPSVSGMERLVSGKNWRGHQFVFGFR